MNRREITTCRVRVTELDANEALDSIDKFPEDTIFLAHQDDGVIWGKVNGGSLITGDQYDSHFVTRPNPDLLQEARFFWNEGEVHIWRDGNQNLQARLIIETDDEADVLVSSYDEPQMLWGDSVHSFESAPGWTRMSDGAQGLVHTVPLVVTKKHVQPSSNEKVFVRPLRLTVRNYLKQHETTGAYYVTLSRLVKLEAK